MKLKRKDIELEDSDYVITGDNPISRDIKVYIEGNEIKNCVCIVLRGGIK